MLHAWRKLFFLVLTLISAVSGGWVLWNMSTNPGLYPMYDVMIAVTTQGILTIWCLRDLYKRRFPSDATKLNWFAAILFLGLVGTTTYLIRVKARQWIPSA